MTELTTEFEIPDNETNILYEADGRVKAATLAKLVSKLTSPRGVEMAYCHDFLLTYRSFTTPTELLDKLILRYRNANAPSEAQNKLVIWLRVFNVIKLWIERYWEDFQTDCPLLSDRTSAFLDEVISTADANNRKVASSVKEMLERKLAMPKESPARDLRSTTRDVAKDPKELPGAVALSLFEQSSTEEIAKQLTSIDWSIWKCVQPWEFLGLAWTKKDKEIRAKNVLAVSERFNYVSGWVATCICTTEKLRDRIKVTAKFIEVASRLKQMNNFNGVMEIVSGLNRGPVFRLKQTFDGIAQKDKNILRTLEELKKLCDRNPGNYATLRAAIKSADPPCIPFLGMYQTDLTFIEEGNQDFVTDFKLINFAKRRLISETIKALKTYQQKAYGFQEIPNIVSKLVGEKILSEDELYEASVWLEPRPNTERGERPACLGGKKKAAEITEPKFDLEFVKEWQPYYVKDSTSNLIMDTENHSIISGSIHKIIERLTHHSSPDSVSLQPFLAIFRILFTPHELLDMVIIRYGKMPDPKDKSEASMEKFLTEMKMPIYLRVFNLLKQWVQYHWHDFADDQSLMHKLQEFIDNQLTSDNPTMSRCVKSLQTIIDKRKEENPEPLPLFPQGTDVFSAYNDGTTICDFDPIDFAKQLTLSSWNVFINVRPVDLLSSQNQLKDTVKQFQQHCSQLEKWVNRELFLAQQRKHELESVHRIISILRQCKTDQNWQGVKSLVEGLARALPNIRSSFSQLSPADRTFFLETQEIFQSYNKKHLIAHQQNDLLAPCVPIVSLFLEDIFALSTNPTEILTSPGSDPTTGLIHLSKVREQAEIVIRFVKTQSRGYGFEVDTATQIYIAMRLQEVSEKDFSLANDGDHATEIPDSSFPIPEKILHRQTSDVGLLPPQREPPPRPKPLNSEITKKQPTTTPSKSNTNRNSNNDSGKGNGNGNEIGSPLTSRTPVSNSGPSVGSLSDIRDVIVDLSLNDSDFKAAVATIVRDTIQEEMTKFRYELKELLHEILVNPEYFSNSTNTQNPKLDSQNSTKSFKTNTTITNSTTNISTNTSTAPTPLVRVNTNGVSSPVAEENLTEDPRYRAVINSAFPTCTLRKWEFHNESGAVPGLPASILSIDMIIRGENTFLLGVRRRIGVDEVKLIVRLGKLYHTQNPNTPLCCVVVTEEITPEAADIADKCKIKLLKVSA